MTNRQIRLIFLLVTFTFLSAANEIYACSCVPEAPVCESFGGSSAVFVGRVVGAAEQKVEKNQDGTETTYDVGEIYFQVEEAFSGVKGKNKVTIYSGTGGADCGYWFLRDEQYLVYANEYEGKFYTSICSRTRQLENATEDLIFLRQLPREGIGARIYGVVATQGEERDSKGEWKVDGLAGITILIKNSRGERTELATDSDGRYEVTGFKPGEYEVQARLPDYYYRDEDSIHKLKVHDRGCARADFAAIPDGRITGRLLDSGGKPVKEAKVVLISPKAQGFVTMNSEIGREYIRAEDQGRFEFSQIPPGEYLLGVNITSSPDAEEPYPPTYYPGVTNRAQATVIKVSLGQKLNNFVLKLPPKLIERAVQGVVLWPDGTPAAGAEVYLADSLHPGWIATGTTRTDALGRFTIKGFEGITYFVLANAVKFPNTAEHKDRLSMHAEPPSITLSNDIFGLKLVLSSEGGLCEHYYQKSEK